MERNEDESPGLLASIAHRLALAVLAGGLPARVMPTSGRGENMPEPRTVLISNRISRGDTPILTSPFPALGEIDQLIPVQRRLHQTANSIGGSSGSSGGSLMVLCMVMPHLKKPTRRLSGRSEGSSIAREWVRWAARQ
jgi:hypothetical protein